MTPRSLNAETDVLIVGAGPVGLFLANECARRGMRYRLVEQRATQSEHSKALAIFPRTLEIFDMAGIAAPFLEAANRVTSVAVRTHGRTLAQMQLRARADPVRVRRDGSPGRDGEAARVGVAPSGRNRRVRNARSCPPWRTANRSGPTLERNGQPDRDSRVLRRRLRRRAQHGAASVEHSRSRVRRTRTRSCSRTSRRTMHFRPASCSFARASSAPWPSFR